ncbi:MAG: spondin domain-containing protein [Rhodobacteraceae bacterium]|nr:spondin domain-containing protein [Paracoccaceae bacterium]
MAQIRIALQNQTANGGLFTTPVWFGAHDAGFDLFNVGDAASAGVEQIAEDGAFDSINVEFDAAQPNGVSGVLFGQGFGDGTPPVVAPGQIASDVVEIDGANNTQLSLMAMILPSNDAFIGTGTAFELFDENGRFAGEQNFDIDGERVYDAGTEVNTELDAAFLNQTAPNTGVDENGVITRHPGFNGSEGNPVGDGDQNVLGGTNAVGASIDPDAADFTQDDFDVATIHVNSVVQVTGSIEDDNYVGNRSDDIVDGGAGDDRLVGFRGWDVLSGGEGDDLLIGNAGSDVLSGDAGNDTLRGGAGDDRLDGGAGNDRLIGGEGDDVFQFETGDGADRLIRYDTGEDFVVLSVDGVSSFDDLSITDFARGALVDFGGGDQLRFIGVDADELSASDFAFV